MTILKTELPQLFESLSICREGLFFQVVLLGEGLKRACSYLSGFEDSSVLCELGEFEESFDLKASVALPAFSGVEAGHVSAIG